MEKKIERERERRRKGGRERERERKRRRTRRKNGRERGSLIMSQPHVFHPLPPSLPLPSFLSPSFISFSLYLSLSPPKSLSSSFFSSVSSSFGAFSLSK